MQIQRGIIRESKIERETVKWAVANGILTVKIQAARGWPDRLFLYRGRCLFIEFKASSGGRVSPMQRRIMEQLESAGIEAHVHNNVDKAITTLKLFMRRRK